jgi:hypothetical protein
MPDESALFSDLKPWPSEAPPADHNQPPLEDRILLDFEDALHRRGLDHRTIEIAESAGRAGTIDTREAAGKAGDLIAAARAVTESVEAERMALNRPLLTAQKSLIAKAAAMLEPMESSISILRKKLDEFIATQDEAITGDHGARVGKRSEWLSEIIDPAKLPLAIRRHPAVVEAMEKVVRAQVRGGARHIAGVRIWENKKADIR